MFIMYKKKGYVFLRNKPHYNSPTLRKRIKQRKENDLSPKETKKNIGKRNYGTCFNAVEAEIIELQRRRRRCHCRSRRHTSLVVTFSFVFLTSFKPQVYILYKDVTYVRNRRVL